MTQIESIRIPITYKDGIYLTNFDSDETVLLGMVAANEQVYQIGLSNSDDEEDTSYGANLIFDPLLEDPMYLIFHSGRMALETVLSRTHVDEENYYTAASIRLIDRPRQ